jgi:hypothetical protein
MHRYIHVYYFLLFMCPNLSPTLFILYAQSALRLRPCASALLTHAQVYYPFPFPPTDEAAKEDSSNEADFTWAVCVDVCPPGRGRNKVMIALRIGVSTIFQKVAVEF